MTQNEADKRVLDACLSGIQYGAVISLVEDTKEDTSLSDRHALETLKMRLIKLKLLARTGPQLSDPPQLVP